MDHSMKAGHGTPASRSNPGSKGGGHRGGPSVRAGAPAGPGAGADGLQALGRRVGALEAALEQLQACTVQQWPDGRLHLPAAHALRIEFGNTRLVMDFRTFTVEVNGQLILGPPSEQPQTTTSSSGSVQETAGASSRGSWRDTAQQGAINNPRQAPGGQRIGF